MRFCNSSIPMATYDNARAASDQKKLEEFCQGLQHSWAEFQKEMKEQLFCHQEPQEWINNQLSELITCLSRLVLQISMKMNESVISQQHTLNIYESPRWISKVWWQSILKARLWCAVKHTWATPIGQWLLRRDYKQAISGRCGKQAFDDSLVELMRFRKLALVEQYQDLVVAILNRIDDMSVSHSRSCFLLKYTVQIWGLSLLLCMMFFFMRKNMYI